MTTNREFRRRLIAREPMVGTFIKTPHPVMVEVIGRAGYDLGVIDAEHGPFDRGAIDTLLIAGRAAGLPLVVRIPEPTTSWLLFVLDACAAGVMVPHVNTAAEAEAIAGAMVYGPGGRGFAGTTRAAGYFGRPMADHLAEARNETSFIAQIEDPEGAGNFEAIAAVDGVDALFVGRADLAVGYGKSDFYDPDVAAICQRVLGARDAATGLYCGPEEDLSPHHAAGASLFVVGSDHTAVASAGAKERGAIAGLAQQS